MKKDFLIKISVLSLIFGMVTAIAAIMLFCMHAEVFAPVYDGTVLSYHEQTADTSELAETLDGAKEGDFVGTVKAEENIPIVVSAPYHQLDEALSYEGGEFGLPGTVYLRADNRVLKMLEKSIAFRAEGCFEKHDYVLYDTKEFGNTDALRAYTPEINNCVIVYAQSAGKIGLKSNYKALIFEEVQL